MGTGDERNFFQSELAYEYAQSQVWNAMQGAYLADRPESRDTNSYIWVREPEDPFSCVIYRADGSVAADTRKSGSRRISADTVFEWTDGYTAECYVNLPAPRGTLLYNYVTLYDFLYNGRDLFLPIGMGCAALTLLLFVFLMAAAGRTPEGIKLGGFHRWPLELYAVLLGTGAAGCVAALLEVVRQDISRYSDVFAAACGTLRFAAGRLPVGELQSALDAYLREKGGEIDYIHGREVAVSLARGEDAIAFILPNIEKDSLFDGIARGGVLPRKTFSMGHAEEKRYYLECRRIKE